MIFFIIHYNKATKKISVQGETVLSKSIYIVIVTNLIFSLPISFLGFSYTFFFSYLKKKIFVF